MYKEQKINDNYLKLLFSVEGRINRAPFWIISLSYLFVLLMLMAITEISPNNEVFMGFMDLLLIVWLIVTIWISFAIIVKRFHDMDKSGWWYLIIFLPPGPLIIFILCGFFRGTVGNNRFGADSIK